MYRRNMSGKIEKVVMFMRICKIIFSLRIIFAMSPLNIDNIPRIDRNVGRSQLITVDELS